ncbi:MAG: (2Fe-2S)-binding protein [Hyphomicrobiales bacterium]|nr:(2Fe-2S)-binding protein [Hyphomicrobiales bacterium]
MFKRIGKNEQQVTFEFLHRTVIAREGDTIAAALLAAGILEFRQAPEDQSRRGPYCMIGNCFECLVQIEGLGSRQACRERVRNGMRVKPHRGRIELEEHDET